MLLFGSIPFNPAITPPLDLPNPNRGAVNKAADYLVRMERTHAYGRVLAKPVVVTKIIRGVLSHGDAIDQAKAMRHKDFSIASSSRLAPS